MNREGRSRAGQSGDSLERRLLAILAEDPGVMEDLRLVASLKLPEVCIAAGYVRNRVWNDLHGMDNPPRLNDVDVIYYDPGDVSEASEKEYDRLLSLSKPGVPWSCKNQARMHAVSRSKPYTSVPDAMSSWPETATAVGITLLDDTGIRIIAPYGLDDLFGLTVRRTRRFADEQAFRSRVEAKQWFRQWPKLTWGDPYQGGPD